MSKAVIDQMTLRLADDTSGLNATFNALAATYGVPATLAIDFSPLSSKSKNFAIANVDADEWVESGAFNFPLVTMYTDRLVNENHQKFHQFSGTVQADIKVWLSWRQERLRIDTFEPLAWCMEEAIITVFNRARNAFLGDQDWGNVVVYNGDISLNKTPVKRGDQMWGQVLWFKLLFEVNQQGDV